MSFKDKKLNQIIDENNKAVTSRRHDGEFFFTYTGVQFWPLDPHIDDINIEDIAHGLAHTCRWGGHSRVFYSVAQHSIVCSHYVARENRLIALMHDAAEAYIGDVKRPLKYAMPNLMEIERNIWLLICKKFGLSIEVPAEVKKVDDRALMAERNEFIHPSSLRVRWPIDELGLEPLIPQGMVPVVSPPDAKKWFIERLQTIQNESH